jgi:hypothetical protein
MLYFDRPSIVSIRQEVETYFGKYLNWSKERLSLEKEELDWHYNNVLDFKP